MKLRLGAWAALFVFVLGFAFVRVGAATELPATSVYRLDVPLVDQDGRALRFDEKRGGPMLVTMFYTSCKYVCPLIIDTLLATDRALDPAERARLGVLVVSFDPERDDPSALKRVADKRRLDVPRWTLARTEAPDVRKLAAVLGIQYRALADREINHTSALVLLDAEGRIVARTDKLGEVDPAFVAKVKATLGEKPARTP
ncbi:MAG TPA: SCO family protein [Rhodanobacteraceae bacterium]|nr:SCO family protein [Rhodanobacteraceae bacterium]